MNRTSHSADWTLPILNGNKKRSSFWWPSRSRKEAGDPSTRPAIQLRKITQLQTKYQDSLLKQIKATTKLIFSSTSLFRMTLVSLANYVLRWCYTWRFATTIFSATQRCNIGATLFQLAAARFIAALCCTKNRRCESSRVTSPLARATRSSPM